MLASKQAFIGLHIWSSETVWKEMRFLMRKLVRALLQMRFESNTKASNDKIIPHNFPLDEPADKTHNRQQNLLLAVYCLPLSLKDS